MVEERGINKRTVWQVGSIKEFQAAKLQLVVSQPRYWAVAWPGRTNTDDSWSLVGQQPVNGQPRGRTFMGRLLKVDISCVNEFPIFRLQPATFALTKPTYHNYLPSLVVSNLVNICNCLTASNKRSLTVRLLL